VRPHGGRPDRVSRPHPSQPQNRPATAARAPAPSPVAEPDFPAAASYPGWRCRRPGMRAVSGATPARAVRQSQRPPGHQSASAARARWGGQERGLPSRPPPTPGESTTGVPRSSVVRGNGTHASHSTERGIGTLAMMRRALMAKHPVVQVAGSLCAKRLLASFQLVKRRAALKSPVQPRRVGASALSVRQPPARLLAMICLSITVSGRAWIWSAS
jgi:hypothetical protein